MVVRLMALAGISLVFTISCTKGGTGTVAQVSGGGNLGIQEACTPKAGDANKDCKIDNADAKLILNANKFKNPAAGTATWAEGDFDGNGKVDPVDLKAMLANLYPKRIGDCNEDGIVGRNDLDTYEAKHNTIDGTAKWADCDFNGDGFVDESDYGELVTWGYAGNTGTPDEKKGDLNLDGVVNALDYLQLSAADKFNLGAEARPTFGEGDANLDGVVDVTDVLLISSYLAQ